MNLQTRWAALRQDLKKHLVLGFAIALAVSVGAFAVGGFAAGLLPGAQHPVQAAVLAFAADLRHPLFAALLGLVAGERAGWLKDYVWDASGRGTVDRDDYLFTGRGAVAGAVVGAALLLILPLTVA